MGAKWKPRLVMFLVFMQVVRTNAQPPLSIFFSDSLTATEDSYFLYNLIGIRSSGKAVRYSIQPPAGWKVLGGSTSLIRPTSDTVLLPVTLVRQSGAAAKYERVGIKFSLEDSSVASQRVDTFFYIRAAAVNSFLVLTPVSTITVYKDTKRIAVPLQIKNTGTSYGRYQIAFRSILFDQDKKFTLRLLPGTDSTLSCTLDIPVKGWKTSQKLLIKVADTSGIIYSLPVTLAPAQLSEKVHPSPFADFPASFETGIMINDKKINYYVGADASSKLGKGSIDLTFRSKLYGMLNTLERNVFVLQLKQPRWDLSLGQLNSVQHFFSYGRGGSFLYRPSTAIQVGVQAILSNAAAAFTNHYYSGWIQKKLPRASRLDRLVANLDAKKGINEYLVYHENTWQPNDRSRFKIHVAIGWEHFLRLSVSSSGNLALGGGYSFQHIGKKWEWSSTWQRFPRNFPGVDKGLDNHLHQLRWTKRKLYVDLFYNYNRVISSVFLDTIYFADAFRFNIEKAGIRVGVRRDHIDISFSTGPFRQTGLSGGILPRYQFGELFVGSTTKRGDRFSFKSFLGYADNPLINRPVFTTNTAFNYQHKSSGVRAFFMQQPVLKDSAVKEVLRINQTLLVSPYVGLRLWERVALQIRYSISKTRYDERITSSAGVTAFWQQPTQGLQLSFSGTFPFTRSAAPGQLGLNAPFVTLSLKKSLQVPVPFKRRYHQMSVLTYEDVNANKRYDSTDRPLSGVAVKINNENFLTDKKGYVLRRNVDTGRYQLSVSSSAYRGLVPPPDNELLIELRRSQKILVPFAKSAVVSGKVIVDPAMYSTLHLVPDNILVKAIDSTGKEYSTLTNERGEYFINVPAASYTVTLNPEAFTGAVRPVTLYQRIDLRVRQEAEVNFILRERNRPMRLLKQ